MAPAPGWITICWLLSILFAIAFSLNCLLNGGNHLFLDTWTQFLFNWWRNESVSSRNGRETVEKVVWGQTAFTPSTRNQWNYLRPETRWSPSSRLHHRDGDAKWEPVEWRFKEKTPRLLPVEICLCFCLDFSCFSMWLRLSVDGFCRDSYHLLQQFAYGQDQPDGPLIVSIFLFAFPFSFPSIVSWAFYCSQYYHHYYYHYYHHYYHYRCVFYCQVFLLLCFCTAKHCHLAPHARPRQRHLALADRTN